MTVVMIGLLFSGMFGAVLGSFLNALSFRYGTGRGMGGRSRCMHCNHGLQARDLIPIVSWIFLQGKCRYCHSAVSAQYPLVEAIAACIVATMFAQYGFTPVFMGVTLFWLTALFIGVYDIRHTVLPVPALVALCVLGFLSLFATCVHDCMLILPSADRWLAGPILAAPLYVLSLVSGGRLMGSGDWVVMLGLGWFLGLVSGMAALMMAFWLGALVGVGLLVWSRRSRSAGGAYTMKSALPFAPFLAIGAFLAHVFHLTIFSFSLI